MVVSTLLTICFVANYSFSVICTPSLPLQTVHNETSPEDTGENLFGPRLDELEEYLIITADLMALPKSRQVTSTSVVLGGKSLFTNSEVSCVLTLIPFLLRIVLHNVALDNDSQLSTMSDCSCL